MIDTVVLLVHQSDFKILDYAAFVPSAKGLFEPPYYNLTNGSINCVFNNKRIDNLDCNYKPRLTLNKRVINGGFSIVLKIEFSAPKLLLGNNFNELETQDFESVLVKLQEEMIKMGVLVDIDKLRVAHVAGMHFGKNIVLNNATSSLIINTITKLGITKRLDLGNTDYRNDGQAVRFHTNSYEIAFYDKVKDLEQAKISEKRAIEGQNAVQFDWFAKEALVGKEILRMEVRLNKTKKIKDVLCKIGITNINTTFYELFNKEISKKILNHFWDNLIAPSLSVVLCSTESTQTLFCKAKSLGYNERKAIQLIGALQLVNEGGIRFLKNILPIHVFNSLKQDLDILETDDNYLYSVFKSVKVELKNMIGCSFNDKVV